MKSESFFPLENAAWPALFVDDSGAIRRANQAAIELFGGVQDGKPSLASSIWSPENEISSEQFLNRLQRLSSTVVSIKLRAKGGTSNAFVCYGCLAPRDGQKGFVLQFFQETHTQTKNSTGSESSGSAAVEASVAHKQKLDCALQLTRTVALDFNNALTSILGHTSLILSKMEHNHPWRSSLVEVEKSAEKAAEIANDLAAFSRQEKDTRAQIAGNLNDLVRRTVELFQTPNSGNIVWTLQLEGRLYTVHFDEAKMQQAFLKILDNATQAVGPEGRITVRTRNQDIDQPTQDGSIRLAPGHYVCSEISDNGCGIAPEVLPRIFEPFFTTKSSPQHRGLGLAWVYGIVTNHGGSVAVASQLGVGTTVRIYLPAQKKIVKDSALKGDDLSGHQTILIVDDEDLLLTMGQMILSSFGYQVLSANSGQKALEIFRQNPKRIDLVITDLVMPNMSGRELIEHLRQISPQVRIICSSGYVRPKQNEDAEAYLQKPFTSQDLLRKVKQALAVASEPS